MAVQQSWIWRQKDTSLLESVWGGYPHIVPWRPYLLRCHKLVIMRNSPILDAKNTEQFHNMDFAMDSHILSDLSSLLLLNLVSNL